MGTLIHLMQKWSQKVHSNSKKEKKKGFVNNNLLQQVKCHFTMGHWLFGKKESPITDKNLKGTLLWEPPTLLLQHFTAAKILDSSKVINMPFLKLSVLYNNKKDLTADKL